MGGGGAGCLQMGRVGIRKKGRGEGRQIGHILTFPDGFTDGHSVDETVDDSDGTIDKSPYGSAISNISVLSSAI